MFRERARISGSFYQRFALNIRKPMGFFSFGRIPDSRFPNEIDGLKQAGFNVIHLRVRRENFESPLTTEQQNHPSETALDHVVPDFLIVNDGTLEDLYNKVCNLVVDRYGVCA